jgi:hypothetical protein
VSMATAWLDELPAIKWNVGLNSLMAGPKLG